MKIHLVLFHYSLLATGCSSKMQVEPIRITHCLVSVWKLLASQLNSKHKDIKVTAGQNFGKGKRSKSFSILQNMFCRVIEISIFLRVHQIKFQFFLWHTQHDMLKKFLSNPYLHVETRILTTGRYAPWLWHLRHVAPLGHPDTCVCCVMVGTLSRVS